MDIHAFIIWYSYDDVQVRRDLMDKFLTEPTPAYVVPGT